MTPLLPLLLTANNFMLVHLSEGDLRIEALTPSTFRVRFSPDRKFGNPRVPVLLNRPASTTVRQICLGRETHLETNRMSVEYDDRARVIRFRDVSGQRFLAWPFVNNKLSPPGQPDPKIDIRAPQDFELSPNEAIYGLGQHQSGLLNYRGSVVKLEQENREIAIPFLVSSRGYGLLWNNAAATTVGVASTTPVLPDNQKLDESGKPGGFTVRYFSGQGFDKELSQTREATIDHDWAKNPVSGVPKNDFSVRWTGFIQAKQGGIYNFKTTADDGARLWIDDKPIIDDWSIHAPTTDTGRVKFAANSRHKLRLEYFQGGGGASMQFSCGYEVPSNNLQIASEAADGIDFCVFYGPSLDKVISEYRNATGNAPMPPKTALGFWQSKERYSSQQEWIDIAAEYRQRQHPIDNLVQDWFYWNPEPWGTHAFDPKRYPDPAKGIESLHNDFHLQFMISVWGKFIPGNDQHPNPNLDLMASKGYLYPNLGANERYYDPFNPDARSLYWQLMRDQIFKKGVDAWWLDASEPELDMQGFRKTMTAAGPGAKVLNAYPLMHTEAVSKGQLRDAPDKRVFILTRSAYAGQQRTGAASWSGDITASWKVYADQIPAGLNFCLSGIPYWTTDIGAFFAPKFQFPGGASDPKYRELFTRWFQYGAFCPIFRVHGTDFAKEMWRFGPDTEKILDKFDRLRYRLMPYIYSQAWDVSDNGGTMMRALVMDFPNDVTARECKDEFMFGPSMLVCPVIKEKATSRSVYLPSGTWFDYWTGKPYQGGKTIVAQAPIDSMPLFVRGGSILPHGPDIQYVNEKPADPIELRIYEGANGSFTLYEDEGMNNNYRKGRYATIPITWNEKTGSILIGARKGSFPGMLNTRTFNLKFIGKNWSTTVRYSGKPISVALYRK